MGIAITGYEDECIAIAPGSVRLSASSIGSTETADLDLNGNSGFVGSCNESMRTIEHTVEQIAPTNLPVLLVGESGTGKSFFAQRLHGLSTRRQAPFVKAICSGLTTEAVDHHFDGAAGDHGNGSGGRGTLFLKEISELSGASQSSLLYSIAERDAEGSGEARGLRLISSSCVDLEEEIENRCFRRDLYYRLKGVCLHLPPLRDRKEDVPMLADTLLHRHSLIQGRPHPNLDAEDFSLLQEWHWPGNIRELDNVIKQIVILNDVKGVISGFLAVPKTDIKSHAHGNRLALKAATRAASRQVEEQLILDALAKTRWNRKRAAQELQISYKSLLSKLKLIGVDKAGKS
jgi:two-component system response regulator AtoC